MSSLEEVRREFWDAWNGLSEVHTQETLEVQSEKMWAARKRLLKVDPEFRAMIKAREDKANAKAEARKKEIQTKYKVLMAEAKAMSNTSISAVNAKVAMRMSETDLDELDKWVQEHRFKVLTPEEAKTKGKMVCPICRKPDRSNNLLNGKPGCIWCNHILVPESELKDYNRAYRRRWKKSHKSLKS